MTTTTTETTLWQRNLASLIRSGLFTKAERSIRRASRRRRGLRDGSNSAPWPSTAADLVPRTPWPPSSGSSNRRSRPDSTEVA